MASCLLVAPSCPYCYILIRLMAPDQLSEYVLNAMRVLCVYAIVYFIAFALEAPTVF